MREGQVLKDEGVGSGDQCEERAGVAAIQSGYIGNELVVSPTPPANTHTKKKEKNRGCELVTVHVCNGEPGVFW